MEKVVYIIGAGFSAPLGIPVMGNFLFKSKDLYFDNPDKYAHFNQVFETINKLSVTKNYYDCDLFNIEEILSIIEMNEFLEGKKLKVDFINYIKNVVSAYTPASQDIDKNLPSNWEDFLFGRNQDIALYGYFVASLMGLIFEKRKSNQIVTMRSHDFMAGISPQQQARYAVLSLNYDMILENMASAINEQYINDCRIEFNKLSYDSSWSSTHLAKLHGCLSNDEIVPPTWAKGTHDSIVPVWKNAFQLLNDANHIRFIGYSLPVADSYIKYLLKAAVIDAPHLKSLDVICMDNDGATKSRYDNFFEFNNYRFKNGSVTNYLQVLKDQVHSRKNIKKDYVSTSHLETAHETFMNNA
ncbi:MAG: hypothetical protein P1U80_10050 [Pseudomonadales bacterium]|nr:hypothetical protein [Pseudomonadales bacterium]